MFYHDQDKAKQEGVGSSQESTQIPRVPPLSDEERKLAAAQESSLPPKTLALAASLEAKRLAERLEYAAALAIGAVLMKTGGTQITLTEADMERFAKRYNLEILPPNDGQVVSIKISPKMRGVK